MLNAFPYLAGALVAGAGIFAVVVALAVAAGHVADWLRLDALAALIPSAAVMAGIVGVLLAVALATESEPAAWASGISMVGWMVLADS